MGKSKTTRFKRPQFNAVGLPVSAVKEDGEENHYEESCPAAELLEKVGPLSTSDLLSDNTTLIRCRHRYVLIKGNMTDAITAKTVTLNHPQSHVWFYLILICMIIGVFMREIFHI